jgi:hypothetical protein
MAAGITAAGTVCAQVGITAEAGTTGLGAHVNIPLRSNLHLRLGAGYFTYNYTLRTFLVDYDAKLKINTYNLLLDWYPVQSSGFRLSAGLAYNGNNVTATGKPNIEGSYLIDGNVYRISDIGVINGKVDFGKVASYLGIGWSKPSTKHKGWAFSTDLGLLLQGSPSTTLTSSGCTIHTIICNLLATDLVRESRSVNEEARDYRVYPVLRLGLRYQF